MQQKKKKQKRKRRAYTAADLAELWDRWKRGESSKTIARVMGRRHAAACRSGRGGQPLVKQMLGEELQRHLPV